LKNKDLFLLKYIRNCSSKVGNKPSPN